MAALEYVASTLLMGALFVVVAAFAIRREGRSSVTYGYGGSAATGADEQSAPKLPGERLVTTAFGNLWSYAVGYVLLVVVVGGGAVLFLLGYDVGIVLLGVVFVLLTGYLFFGVYWLSRSRGRSTARATAEGVSALVALLLLAVVAKLLVAG